MTPALGVPSAFELVQLTFSKWFPGMVVEQVKLRPRLAQKIASAASDVKQLVLLIS